MLKLYHSVNSKPSLLQFLCMLTAFVSFTSSSVALTNVFLVKQNADGCCAKIAHCHIRLITLTQTAKKTINIFFLKKKKFFFLKRGLQNCGSHGPELSLQLHLVLLCIINVQVARANIFYIIPTNSHLTISDKEAIKGC